MLISKSSIFSGKSRDRTIKYFYQDGLKLRESNVRIPRTSRPDLASCYVFAFPKSGSTMANNIVTGLMQESRVPVVDIPSYIFSKGIDLDTAVFDCQSLFSDSGYCYLGFRKLPAWLRGVLSKLHGPKILLVRDPRDMLVSKFYSLKFSHLFPKEGTEQFSSLVEMERSYTNLSIDDFCISDVSIYRDIYDRYYELLGDENVKVIRYEDIIFEKLKFADHICELFSLDIKPDRLKEIVAPWDVRRSGEIPTEHIRQVDPGDYRRKLQASTIGFLNVAFKDFMQKFGYQA